MLIFAGRRAQWTPQHCAWRAALCKERTQNIISPGEDQSTTTLTPETAKRGVNAIPDNLEATSDLGFQQKRRV
ncbi:hypothetical protein RRG08_014465 [Elysia crispata]|uniref:Uncharacterized protein n=1 Tax=Elysia crispata TaxID=231223 RepID=A0AAE0Y5H4_9GAST|nr:hypothetical protein RRG08_014465 [Elysia crispata]